VRIGAATRALVTGASRGIGLATAAALRERGASVGMVARGKGELEARAEELGAVALPADVADYESIAGAVEQFAAAAGGIDLLVANAGIVRYAPYAEQPLDDIEQMVRVNVLGTLYSVKAALPHLLDHADGHIVVVSSGAGLRAFPWGAVYGATKAADKGFAEALRHELSGTGVSLSTVFPGEVATDLHAEAEQLPDWRDSDGAIPATDVADAVLKAVEEDRREVHVPANVRLLALNDLAPGLLDRLLALLRGGSAAPRRY